MGYQIGQNNTTEPLLFLMVDAADHISPKTGLTVTVTISKNGGAFASPAGSVTEVGNGWYKVSANATDANTVGPLIVHATGTDADPCDEPFDVVTFDPTVTTTTLTPVGTATGQSILNRMEILKPELQLQTGESGVAKALVAINMAVDIMEAQFALNPEILGDSIGTVTTTADTETTAWPVGLLRLDKLQYLDDETNRPAWDVPIIQTVGGHSPSVPWPLTLTVSTSTGAPRGAYVNGRHFYWSPVPDATYTVRYYGLLAMSDVTALGNVPYPDICLTPLAAAAVRLLSIGLDDEADSLQGLAEELFEPVIRAMSGFRRDAPLGFVYDECHDT